MQFFALVHLKCWQIPRPCNWPHALGTARYPIFEKSRHAPSCQLVTFGHQKSDANMLQIGDLTSGAEAMLCCYAQEMRASHPAPVPKHVCCVRLHLLQRFECSLGVGLLPNTNNSIDEQDEQNHARLYESSDAFFLGSALQICNKQRYHSSNEQDLQRVSRSAETFDMLLYI